MGMANFNKNLFVGVGGVEAINLSHFIGAIHGMERMMGKANNPLRDILNYASEMFLHNRLPLWYILTVMGTNSNSGSIEMKGFYIGNDIRCYLAACELSIKTNITLLDEPLHRVVVYLDPDEYHSTWLGNKAIYRTRMAIADGGHLVILAPGVSRFGEDDQVDRLLRRYGYRGTTDTLQAMKDSEELQQNLSAVSHLIHGSTEGRFRVTYCPGGLSQEEVESVGYQYGDLDEMKKLYPPETMTIGWNNGIEGGPVFYIPNPALGLWAVRSKFENGGHDKHSPKESRQCNSPSSAEADARTKESTRLMDLVVADHQCSAGGSGGVSGWIKPPM